MDDVWKAPGEASNPRDSGEDSPREGTEELAQPTDVLTALVDDLKQHPGAYFMSGLGYTASVFVLIVVAVGAIAIGVAPGMVLENETFLVIGGIGGFLIYFSAIMVFSFVLAPLMMASTIRAADAHLSGGPTLGFGSAFSSMGERAGTVIAFYLVQQVLVLIGALMLYLPAFIAMALCQFAFVILVLDEVSIGEALSRAFEHMKKNAGWHVVIWLMLLLLLLAAELTIVGIVFLWPAISVYGVLVHRAAKA